MQRVVAALVSHLDSGQLAQLLDRGYELFEGLRVSASPIGQQPGDVVLGHWCSAKLKESSEFLEGDFDRTPLGGVKANKTPGSGDPDGDQIMMPTNESLRRYATKSSSAVLLLFFLLFSVSAAQAQFPTVSGPFLEFTPSQPTTQDVLNINISGTWNNGCVPTEDTVDLQEFRIEFSLVTSTGPCSQALTDYSIDFQLTGAAAGTIEVIVFIDGTREISEFVTVKQPQTQSAGPFLEVTPSQPTTADVLNFNISGTFSSGCVPAFDEGRVQGFTIEIFLLTSTGPCTQALTDYSIDVTSDPLAAGTYEVIIFIDGTRETSEFVTVKRPQTQPTVSFRSSRVSVDEAGNTVSVIVERQGSSQGTVRVDYATSEQTARAGFDYKHSQGTLTWQDGDLSPKTVSVRILDDFDTEGTEDFRIDLLAPTGAALGSPKTVTIEIADDDTVQTGGTCRPDSRTLCLQNGRYSVTSEFSTPQGDAGQGNQGGFTDETGYFWFFSQDNVEVLIKVLNGCGINDKYWVFIAGLTNVRVQLEVTDTQTGETKSWTNPLNRNFQPIEDTTFFSCGTN